MTEVILHACELDTTYSMPGGHLQKIAKCETLAVVVRMLLISLNSAAVTALLLRYSKYKR